MLHGRLEFIRGLVIHEGDDVKCPKAAFQEAVDDSLAHCEVDERKLELPQ